LRFVIEHQSKNPKSKNTLADARVSAFDFQSPVIVSGCLFVSSRQVVGLLPSSRRIIEIAPGDGQTK
jgi:hypothetical protein